MESTDRRGYHLKKQKANLQDNQLFFGSLRISTKIFPCRYSSQSLVSFLARSKPKVPFRGISLLRNQKETLATQAKKRLTSFCDLIVQ